MNGSGPKAKWFFKLRTAVEMITYSSGNATTLFTDDASNSSDWTNVANLFEFYRTCAMKIKFPPTVTADTSFAYLSG